MKMREVCHKAAAEKWAELVATEGNQ